MTAWNRLGVALALALTLCLTGMAAVRRWGVLQRFVSRTTSAGPAGLDEVFVLERGVDDDDADGPEADDPRVRKAAQESYFGPRTPADQQAIRRTGLAEARRWPHLMPQRSGSTRPGGGSRALGALPDTGTLWVSLGPTDASYEQNGTGNSYAAVDSGRLTAIAVHPANDSIVYLATAGGGVWKTYDVLADQPSWIPVSETIGNLAIGALAIDPSAPDTLYAGLGDAFDKPGGEVIKSSDGALTWSSGLALAATDGSGAARFPAGSVREIRVDPHNGQHVLVTSDVGLFQSVDGGASFAEVKLPHGGSTGNVLNGTWSVVHGGLSGGNGRWAVSGVSACDVDTAPPPAGGGQSAGTACPLGNLGDVWTSSDDGATWTSQRTAGTLPSATAGNAGRITLGAGTADASGNAVIFAQVSSTSEQGSTRSDRNAPVAYWRSADSGVHWTDATGTISLSSPDCTGPLVGAGQSWYNAAVAVDPGNSDNVLIGGQLCGVRSRNATTAAPVWDLVAHWLPTVRGGVTAAGPLGYVHADWHAAVIIRSASSPSGYRVFAGSDGGLFVSTDVFVAKDPTGRTVPWTMPNRGLVTHLGYALASGEEATGNPDLVFFGLQDNGTRYRRPAPAAPGIFDQVYGGDGIGPATNRGPGGWVNWSSVPGNRVLCVSQDAGTPVADCGVGDNWRPSNPSSTALGCSGDTIPFFVYLTPARADPAGTAVLTHGVQGIYQATGTAPNWSLLACFDATTAVRRVDASETIDGLYGAALNGGRAAIASGCSASSCSWTVSSPLFSDQRGVVRFTTHVAFPPVTPAGKSPGDVLVVSSSATTFLSASGTVGPPIPPEVGHLFLSTDRGTTFTPLHGNGTSDLPNVPVNVVRYDPSDATGNTLYVGTDIGVYRTTDGGQTWQRFGAGLPLVQVNDLFVARNGAMVRIATYGRGVWQIDPSATSTRGTPGNGDADRSQAIDFRDLAAMAMRLGTTPASPTPPYYDWNLDLTGPSPGIDDDDLSALLSRFGGAP